jgi:hypothetical protein
MRAREFITEHELVWTRRKITSRGGKPVLKWRCTSGLRKGRVVPDVRDCDQAPDQGRREAFKKTRARTKLPQARRAKRTKKINVASRLIARLNKLR